MCLLRLHFTDLSWGQKQKFFKNSFFQTGNFPTSLYQISVLQRPTRNCVKTQTVLIGSTPTHCKRVLTAGISVRHSLVLLQSRKSWNFPKRIFSWRSPLDRKYYASGPSMLGPSMLCSPNAFFFLILAFLLAASFSPLASVFEKEDTQFVQWNILSAGRLAGDAVTINDSKFYNLIQILIWSFRFLSSKTKIPMLYCLFQKISLITANRYAAQFGPIDYKNVWKYSAGR